MVMEMYNRKTLCILADMNIEAFKNAAKVDRDTGLDDLPIIANDGFEDDLNDVHNRKSYSRYTPKDVLAVAAAVQLSSGGGYMKRGLPFPVASHVILNNRGFLAEAVRRYCETGAVELVGYAALRIGGQNVFGTLDEIASKFSGNAAAAITNLHLLAPICVFEAISERAKLNGIDWSAEALWQAD
ncbi:hypothetical protein BN949_03977 [Agrobacterium tumefaciens]|nr:hypothetical protein BN949_03977 [Agrobacterium tumefaciens]